MKKKLIKFVSIIVALSLVIGGWSMAGGNVIINAATVNSNRSEDTVYIDDNVITENYALSASEQQETSDSGSGTCGDNLIWELSTDGTLVISGTGDMYDYAFGFGNPSPFHGNSDIQKVIIKEGVTSIGDSSFDDCRNLTSVEIADTVTRIGEAAFSNCRGLVSIVIPDTVNSIGEHAFSYCIKLENIKLSNSITSIEYGTFFECNQLSDIVIPDGVTLIDQSAFSYCENLTEISIPESVLTIGTSAFQGCSGLISVKLPSNLTEISDQLFSGCNSLMDIILPDSIESIGRLAFYDCTNLEEISIPDIVSEIGDSAFEKCSSLTSMIIPDKITIIPSRLFYSCDNLASVTIPSGVTSIGTSAFCLCENLSDINIPSSVTYIGSQAFRECESIHNFTIPDGVTTILASTFYYCKSLEYIVIPKSVTKINDYAFSVCSSLKDVYYSGTREEWSQIDISSVYNTELKEAAIHYNYNGSALIPDESFKISKSGAWVAGKECSLSGIYSASVPGNVLEEVENIIWESSDPSILDVSSPEIDLDIADTENTRVTIVKSFTAKKAGTVTVTATAPDGRSESLTVDVEPELMVVETEERIRRDSTITLCKMTIDEPNADFLQSVMSGVELQVSEDSDNVFEITNTYYRISDDGLSAEFLCDLKPVDAGRTSFTLSTAGGQEVSTVLKSGLLSLEKDIWSFTNAYGYFGTGADGYYITSADYNRLISQLSFTERQLISSEGLLNNYNIDGNSSNVAEWAGSCHGMATWVLLNNAGVRDASDIDNSVPFLYQYSLDANENNAVESAINYYFRQQHLTAIQNEAHNFMAMSQHEQISELEEMVNSISDGGNLVFIWYLWYESFDNKGNADADSGAGHMVVAYDIETGDYSDFVYETMPADRRECVEAYNFDHRILVYDCNDPENNTYDLYYSENSSVWCIPGKGIVSTTSQSRNNEFNNGMFALVTNETDLLNAVDYNTGEISQIVKDTQKKDIHTIISLASNDYSVAWSSGSVDISGFSVLNNTSDEQIFALPVSGITADGNTEITQTTVFVPQSSSYFVSSEDVLGFQMNLGNYLTTVVASAGGNIEFPEGGGAKLDASDPTQYYIDITANEGYYTLPWYRIYIEGQNASEISAQMTDEGVLLEGDTLENVIVTGTNNDETQELNFSTDEDIVLISASDDELVVLADTDDDGVYETDVNDIEDHVHTYAAPEFVWSEDYSSCNAVFTCVDEDSTQEIACEISAVKTKPTCTEAGKITYTASVSFNGNDYSDVQTVEGDPATGHNYDYKDNGDGTHTRICSVCGDSVTGPHTFLDGFCSYCGAEEPADHTHTYGTPEFIWSEDCSSCNAVFTCTDGDDQQTVNCTIVAKDNGDGTVTYTATVEFNGETYSDSKQSKVPDESDVTDQDNGKPESGVTDSDDGNNGNNGGKDQGSVSATSSSDSSVKTGDASQAGLWIIVILAGAGAASLALYRKRKNTIK